MDSLPPAGQVLFSAQYIPGQRLLPAGHYGIHPGGKFLHQRLCVVTGLAGQPQGIDKIPLAAFPQRHGALAVLLHGDGDNAVAVAVSYRKLALFGIGVVNAGKILALAGIGGAAQGGGFIGDLPDGAADETEPGGLHAVPVGVADQLKIRELVIFIGDSRVRDLGVPADCRTGIGVGRGGRRFAAGGQSRRQQAAQGQSQYPGQLFHVVSSCRC